MEYEILTSESRQGGIQYVRYAGWRDETHRAQGRGDYRLQRPDGGEIVADLLNDHRIQIPPLGRELVIRGSGNGNPRVHHLPTNTWVDLLTYRGPLSDLEYREWTIDVEAEFVRPAISRFIARTHASGRWGDRTGTTLNLIVGASSDDAFDQASDGTMTLASSVVRCFADTTASSRFNGGFRFDGVTVPNGATINSATMVVNATSATRDDMAGTIYAEDADDAGTFTTTAGNMSGRARTTAGVAWSQDSLGIGAHDTPDISAVIAEVTSRGGWVSGNAIVILFDASTSVVKDCDFRAYDASTTLCGRLDIDYTAAAAGVVLVPRARRFPHLRM